MSERDTCDRFRRGNGLLQKAVEQTKGESCKTTGEGEKHKKRINRNANEVIQQRATINNTYM